MAKRVRAPKVYEEDEQLANRSSINGTFKDKEQEEDVQSINNALDEEEERTTDVEEQEQLEEERIALLEEQQRIAEEESAGKGFNLPTARAQRDPSKNKDPLEGEDLGLMENDFLISRKVSLEDLEFHNKMNEEALLGSNVRKLKDFMEIFERGSSSEESPKIDTMYNIENNRPIRQELVVVQILRNYHSKNNLEKNNAWQIIKELKLDDELIKRIKDNDDAHEDRYLIDVIKERI